MCFVFFCCCERAYIRVCLRRSALPLARTVYTACACACIFSRTVLWFPFSCGRRDRADKWKRGFNLHPARTQPFEMASTLESSARHRRDSLRVMGFAWTFQRVDLNPINLLPPKSGQLQSLWAFPISHTTATESSWGQIRNRWNHKLCGASMVWCSYRIFTQGSFEIVVQFPWTRSDSHEVQQQHSRWNGYMPQRNIFRFNSWLPYYEE